MQPKVDQTDNKHIYANYKPIEFPPDVPTSYFDRCSKCKDHAEIIDDRSNCCGANALSDGAGEP